MDYLDLCQTISQRVKAELVRHLTHTGFMGDTLANPQDLKSTHAIDAIASQIVLEVLQDYPCNIYMESFQPEPRPDATFSIFIDPVDGSLNWDRGIGDPCIVIAIAPKTTDIRLQDLSDAYVEGLRSGDYYYTQAQTAYFYSHTTQQTTPIHCRKTVSLAQATVYLRPGYSLAKNQLSASFPLLLLSRDIRAVDNAGMEICEIARNAADLMVEARQGSDNFNLLAYPILKYAGGCLCDLAGHSLENLPMQQEQQVDYIACNSPQLLAETLSVLQEFQRSQQYVQDNLKFSFQWK